MGQGQVLQLRLNYGSSSYGSTLGQGVQLWLTHSWPIVAVSVNYGWSTYKVNYRSTMGQLGQFWASQVNILLFNPKGILISPVSHLMSYRLQYLRGTERFSVIVFFCFTDSSRSRVGWRYEERRNSSTGAIKKPEAEGSEGGAPLKTATSAWACFILYFDLWVAKVLTLRKSFNCTL